MPAKKKAARKKKAAARKGSTKKAAKKRAAKKTSRKKKAARKKAAARKGSTKKAAKKRAAKKTSRKKKAAKRSSSRKATSTKTHRGVPTPESAATAPRPASPTGGPLHGFEPYNASRGEEYMNDEQVEHFRQILMAWKRELMEEVDRTVHHMKDEAANFPDPNDRATQESEFSLELRTRDRERKLIKKIDEALTNLGNEEYGYCDSCGIEIGIRRLEARPTATLCIDCKTLDEIRERQLAG